MKLKSFPMGFWNGMRIEKLDVNSVKDWRDCGMTLAMSPQFGAGPDHERRMLGILDAADEKGISVILCHDSSGSARSYRGCSSSGSAMPERPGVGLLNSTEARGW